MKTCTRCGTEKSLAEFYKNSARRDGLQTSCKACDIERNTAFYRSNREEQKKRVSDRKRKLRQAARQFVFDFLSEHPCVDCDSIQVLTLQFDHVRGRKRRDVSELVSLGYPLKVIQEEIAKCEVRCANCHTIRTKRLAHSWMCDAVKSSRA